MSRADNPWMGIDLCEYEKHMAHRSVMQLQALDAMMKDQLRRYSAKSACVLGVAGGNGLEHADCEKMDVYGVDINPAYLAACAQRHPGVHTIEADARDEGAPLPRAELVIANLFIEYVGCAAFARAVHRMGARFASCAIQMCGEEYVSDSPHRHIFDHLGEVHREIKDAELCEAMRAAGYAPMYRECVPLPNGMALLRVDFERTGGM